MSEIGRHGGIPRIHDDDDDDEDEDDNVDDAHHHDHDCVRAEPVIYKTFESSEKKFTLLRAYVGDRPTWRNPSHPWRLDKRFKVKGVPTLLLWKDGAAAGRLEDHEAHLADRIEKLLSIAMIR